MGETPQNTDQQPPLIKEVPNFDTGAMPPATVESGLPSGLPTGYEGFGTDEHAQALADARDKAVVAGTEAAGVNQITPVSESDLGAENPDPKDKYGYLLNPNTSDSEFGVDKAAVWGPAKGQTPPAQTSDRPGYFKPATQEQINKAAEYGFDLKEANDKHYPGWDKE